MNKNNFVEITSLIDKSYKINDPELFLALYYELYNRLLINGCIRTNTTEYLSELTVTFQTLMYRVNNYHKNINATELMKLYINTLLKNHNLSLGNEDLLNDFMANLKDIKTNILLQDKFQIVKNSPMSKKSKLEVFKELWTYLSNIKIGLNMTMPKEYIVNIISEIEKIITDNLETYIALYKYDDTISISDFYKKDVKNILMDYFSDMQINSELQDYLSIYFKSNEFNFMKLISLYYLAGYINDHTTNEERQEIIKEACASLGMSKLESLRISCESSLTMLKLALNNFKSTLTSDDSITR